MRLKSLRRRLQMVPSCFAAAAAASTTDSSEEGGAASSPVRVVGSDGVVHLYHLPVSAAEVVTKNYPSHLVCRADADFTIGQKVPALSAADRLLPGHSYLLLPSQFFHSALSFVSVASFLLLLAAPSPDGRRGSVIRPFRIHRSATGALQVIVCGDGDELAKEDEKGRASRNGRGGGGCGGGTRVCTSEKLEKEYRDMVGARRERRWRPKLETIGEGEMEKKGRRRRSGGGGGGGGEGFVAFGFGRRRRKRGTAAAHDDDDDE